MYQMEQGYNSISRSPGNDRQHNLRRTVAIKVHRILYHDGMCMSAHRFASVRVDVESREVAA